jgi:lysophospholipase L1-like esterase
MRINRLASGAIAVLSLSLAASVYLNVSYYGKARDFYAEVNRVRLDPLGLDAYAAHARAPAARTGAPLVVFFGDSRAAEWPAPRLAGLEFANLGLGAQTSAQALGRYPHHVTPLAPAVVVIQVGVNDLKAIKFLPGQERAIVERCKANLRALVDLAARDGAHVVIATIFPPGAPSPEDGSLPAGVLRAIDEVNRAIGTLAGDRVTVLDAARILANGGARTDAAFSKDLLHVNGSAYEALNRDLAPVLAPRAARVRN